MTSRADPQGGFTLIEVLVVLAILGLAIGIIASGMPARSPALDARGAADQVARALRLARSQAIVSNQPVAFTLDLRRHAFRVADGPWQQLPPTLTFGMAAASENGAPPTQGRIVFDPDGGATGGRVRIATAARTESAGAASARGRSGRAGALSVETDWLSGRVTVSVVQ